MNKLILVLLVMLSGSAFAEGSQDHNILRIEVGDGGFNLYLIGSNFTASTCSPGVLSTVNDVISFAQTDFPNGYSHMLSTAMTAFTTKKKVSMWYSGCQTSPWNNDQMPKPTTLVIK
ncbi:MAG: hypothetical protein MJK04_18760 [Psychrosphaera sp.]|nr:hypothetical protein [Psychrosphaera sp.]